MLKPKTNSQTWRQRASSHVMSGTIFSICSILAFSAQQAAPQRCRKECNKEQEKRELRQSRSRRWTWFRRLKQVLRLCWVQMHPTVRWYSEHPVNNVRISLQVLGETSRLVFKSKWRSVKFSSVAYRCTDERTCEETRCCRHEPRSEFLQNVHGNLPLKTSISTTKTTRSGRTISANLVLTFHISRKSTRIFDSNSSASQKTKWRTSMWIRWYGERSWWSPNKRQFILETIIWRIRIQPKIGDNEQWNNCSMWQRIWSGIRKKSQVSQWSTGKKILGKGRLGWLTGQFSYQQQKPTYSPTRFCAWAESVIIPQAHGTRKSICLGLSLKVDHHVFSDMIPFTVRLVSMNSVPFLFRSRPKKRPMSVRESSCKFCYGFGIRSTQFFVSFFFTHIVVVHWHEDDSSLQLLRFTLSFSHHVLDLGENLQCSESWEISFNSISIGSPSIRSSSRHWDELDIPYSVDSVLLNEDLCEAKEKENCPYTSVATTTPLNWFFARSSPSISSVCTEQ